MLRGIKSFHAGPKPTLRYQDQLLYYIYQEQDKQMLYEIDFRYNQKKDFRKEKP